MHVEPFDRHGDAEALDVLQRLVEQLSSSAPPLTAERLDELVDGDAATLFVARDDDGGIVGMLTLVCFAIPTGRRAWIEDVVVDDAARGRGIGTQLIRTAIVHAQTLGARTVDLTSRPDREAANVLYRRLGFVQRDTNVYRYELSRAANPPGPTAGQR
jgi:ribosomal protein S18 acetylase RimI-like enzyme